MIPIYFGVGDEANQGLCTGSENYWCVNKNASEEDIQATLDFMYWWRYRRDRSAGHHRRRGRHALRRDRHGLRHPLQAGSRVQHTPSWLWTPR